MMLLHLLTGLIILWLTAAVLEALLWPDQADD